MAEISTKKVYLDFAASTYVDSRVVSKMLPYLSSITGNPSSLHSEGRKAKKILESSRNRISSVIGCLPQELIFTSSGTESDNLALLGICRAYKNKGNHLIVSRIEHKAVIECAKKLESEGFDVTYLSVSKNGLINYEDLKKSLRENTVLVSIMYANNEIGTIQSIKKISSLIKQYRKSNFLPLFHTDATQAANYLDISKTGVDLMTLDSSKIYGPKGIACLYAKEGINFEPIIYGGHQEKGYRSGTENPWLASGFAEALHLCKKEKGKESKRLRKLQRLLLSLLKQKIKGIKLNGDSSKRLPNNINISIAGVEGEALVLMLDEKGICASTGSACASASIQRSHVLESVTTRELAQSSVRITLGRSTKLKDIYYAVETIASVVDKLRKISCI
jgi:cysteine desulfurase